MEPEEIVGVILQRFPSVRGELKQLLGMVDSGQGVDISGIPDRSLVKLIKELFHALKLKKEHGGIYLLPPSGAPTLEVVRSKLDEDNQPPTVPRNNIDTTDVEHEDKPFSPPRRIIGPAMPSRELLAAAAELTEAETLLREADLEVDHDLFIGPPPPAVVAEAASANEAERFEEVDRIAAADPGKPYDVLGVNWKMSPENIKKRYWKLSLMVHPDKCSHPQAHQVFVVLNKAFKDLQDPDKRKEIDEKLKQQEEEEAFKAELKSLREAAQWRKLQGISLEGDDELLAVTKEAPKRDEWMTALPPERKPGVSMHSTTSFSRTGKEGRGDTSAWTDNPLDKAAMAKQNYLEAYNKAKSLADSDEQKRYTTSEADLVDKYNSSKRGKSLVEKHNEERKAQKKKTKQQQREKHKEEWEDQHPWKPWDREKDLVAGRAKVNLDSAGMEQGLSSRFASGNVQRSFL